MFYNSYNNFEYSDCVSHGACSVSPTISSMQEVMFILLRQTAYYLVKLREFNIRKIEIEKNVITAIALIDTAKDLSEVQILDSFSKHYINLVKVRKEYLKICQEKNVQARDLADLIKLSPKTSLSSILKKGNKEFLYKYKRRNSKYFSDILSAVMKSVCVNLVSLFELGKSYEPALDCVLNSLNLFNFGRVSAKKLTEFTQMLAKFDVEILKTINEYQLENYGNIEETVVSYSTRPNKAILVSGSNLNDLNSVLSAVKDKNIDVYTNGNLLIAHSFPYFKNFKNLRGHFGSGVFSTILDFATFPGAILLTKNEFQNIEYLYRGRLFTTDDIAPKGIVKLENDDLTLLVESALQAKGFAKGQKRGTEIIGLNEEKFKAQIRKFVDCKHIFVIGPSSYSIKQKDYFERFFEIIPKDTGVISFSYNAQKDNIISINLGNNYALLYRAMQVIFETFPVDSEKLAFFMTKCDINSLSNIINLKTKGAKHIFLSDCPPLVINPAVLREFASIFGVKHITNPKDDLDLLIK